MLIEIATKDARLGMYVHAVEGGWLASPFWRSHLVLSKPSEIAKLVKAGIATITIDTSKGVGPAQAAPPAPPVDDVPAIADRRVASEDAPYSGPERRLRKRGSSELDRARETVERSKEAVSRMFAEVRMGNAVDAADVSPLVDEIAESVARDATAMLKVTRLKNKDEYTYLHSVAVCALMINFARRLNLPEDEVRDLGMAGLLHDIGKMSVPSALLDKPGALEPGERSVVQSHPVKGHQLLSESENISAAVLDVCLHHHERVDGTGYPERLTGEQLSLHARMSAICDVYDAVTSNRPYKRPWSPSEALARMRSWEGHFDPALFAIFIESIGIYPVGGLVRMGDNKLAVILTANDEDPTAPRVRCFYDIPAQAMVPHRDVDTGGGASHRTILRSERGEHWFGDNWSAIHAQVQAGPVDDAAPRRTAVGA
ncbi:HD-GYP domain-containing protein [Sphingomonas adhaesiva]|uniref:HD-GYP domain-containing protein n=1 Tax=Sphingomonas adhaesiva TaxID=28212 RepID=UPI002FFA5E10